MSIETGAAKHKFFRKLTDAELGETVKIVGMQNLSVRLAELGLTQNTLVRVVRTAPLGDPLEIEVRGYLLCIRKQTAEQIQVVPVIPPQTPLANASREDTNL